jgi:O-antigen ligase
MASIPQITIHTNEDQMVARSGPPTRFGVILTCLAILTASAFILFPDFLASWVAVRFLAVGAILVMALLSASARLDANTITFRLALVLWFFLLISEEIFDRAGGNEIEGDFSSVAYGEIGFWVLAIVVLFVVLIRNTGYLHRIFARQSKWIFFFAAFCMLSACYSPQPRFSAAWALKLTLVITVLATCSALIQDEEDLVAFVKTTFWACVCLMLYGTFADLSLWSAEGRLGESPTSLAVIAGIVLVLSFTLRTLSNGGVWPLLLRFGASLIMILTGGKAGIVGGVFSVVLLFLLKKKLGSAVGLLGIFIGLGILLVLLSTPLRGYAGAYLEHDQADNLSGRTDLWIAALPLIRQSPLIGHGYMASKFISLQIDKVGWEAGHLHNAFLDVLYNNGLVGLFFILYINVRIVSNLFRVLRYPGVSRRPVEISVGLLVIYSNLLINSFFNAIIGGRPSALFMIFLTIFMLSERLRKNLPRRNPGSQKPSAWAGLSIQASNTAKA